MLQLGPSCSNSRYTVAAYHSRPLTRESVPRWQITLLVYLPSDLIVVATNKTKEPIAQGAGDLCSIAPRLLCWTS